MISAALSCFDMAAMPMESDLGLRADRRALRLSRQGHTWYAVRIMIDGEWQCWRLHSLVMSLTEGGSTPVAARLREASIISRSASSWCLQGFGGRQRWRERPSEKGKRLRKGKAEADYCCKAEDMLVADEVRSMCGDEIRPVVVFKCLNSAWMHFQQSQTSTARFLLLSCSRFDCPPYVLRCPQNLAICDRYND